MSWNYRIVRRVHKIGDAEQIAYGIYEAYYNQAGNPDGITENPVDPYGEDLTELIGSFELMKKAFDKPVLDYYTLKEVEWVPNQETIDALNSQDTVILPTLEDLMKDLGDEKD